MKLVKEFKKEYQREEEEEVRQQEAEEDRKVFSRELPERYTVKLLYEWGNKRYNQEYWKKIGENGKGICFQDTTGIHS